MTVGDTLRGLAPHAFVESEVRHMRHTWKFGDPYMAPINPPGETRDLSLWMVQRSIFDNALAQRAAGAGADLQDGVAVRSIEPETDRVIVRGAIGSGAEVALSSRFVIGADGANGITARAAGLRRNRTLAIAMEIEHPHTWGSGHPELKPDVAHLEYGAVNRGYAWIFPKGDHLNVGAGVFRPRNEGRGDSGVRPLLQRTIFRYLDSLGVAYDPNRALFHAHPLPIWNGKEPLQSHDGRILLAGDAAGLVNPIFGDGILHAIKSGLIAAECVSARSTPEYTNRIHAEFAANFDAALHLARFFYQWTGTVYRHAIKRPGATRAATRLLCGEALFTDVAGKAINRLKGKLPGMNRNRPSDSPLQTEEAS